MPITQVYKINTDNAYEGMVYGLRTAMTIRTVEAGDAFAHEGGAVVAKPNTMRAVTHATTVAGKKGCYGIIVRQVNHEAATRPSDGTMQINEGDLLGMMVEGEIMVKLGAAVKRDDFLQYDATNHNWKNDATNVYTNVKALQSGAQGDLVPARIFSVTDVQAAPAAVKASK